MMDSFQIVQSNKVGLDSKESYIVMRDEISFLRILGDEPEWQLMTATASEDHGRVVVCANQLRLVESALRLGAELETKPRVERDWRGREYVKVCVITRESEKSDATFNEENAEVFRRFFEIYDSYKDLGDRVKDETHELYAALAIDNEGGDIYLSDGVWLSSDGSLHDRGR
jgi:hypothetical protein